MERLSWMVWVGSKGNHTYPYKSEAKRKFYTQEEEGNVKIEQRDI